MFLCCMEGRDEGDKDGSGVSQLWSEVGSYRLAEVYALRSAPQVP